MLSGYVFTSGIFALFFIILGLLALFRNQKLLVNKLFLAFSVFAACWLVTNYLAGDPSTPYRVALISNHLVLAFASLMSVSLIQFVVKLSEITWKQAKVAATLNLVAAALCLTPFVVRSVNSDGKTYAIEFGVLATYYFLVLFYDFISIIYLLYRSRHEAKGLLKAQINIIALSFGVSLSGLMITNAVLPSIFNYYGLTNAGSLFSAFLVAGVAYTIIRHKLFDIRLIVARSLAYVLSLLILIVVFTGSTLGFTNLVLQNNDINETSVKLSYTTLAVLLSIFFSPVKRFFDKITNNIFYRDAYDAQVFLDELNKILVSTYEIRPLLNDSLRIIHENIKPTYSIYGINETATTPQKIVASEGAPRLTQEDMKIVKDVAPKAGKKLIVTDDLKDTFPRLQRMLRKNDIAVLARLSSSNTDEGIGYLMLGPKKSGNLYSAQDLRILEIIANELVIAIQNSLRVEEIANFNITLQAKVNDATRKLKNTNEKLKALDETKDDFISMASHQLRTPLTSVKGYISMVLEEDAGKVTPMQKEMLGQAFFSSQRMVYLIADLLNVSRLKTGKFIIEPAPVNLANVIEEELIQLKETAAARDLKLKYTKPKKFPDVMLDETKIRQVIMNFVDNAIYYTPAGGTVTVELEDHKDSVELHVKDNGIGVPKSEQPHLFSKFYRAGNARKARPDGTGLGLFMAKKVVMAQGGSVLFHSQEGKGSTFGFVFNKKKLALQKIPVKPAPKP